MNEGGKKDPFKRRQELLVDSGLAEVRFSCCWCIGNYDISYLKLLLHSSNFIFAETHRNMF